jgi:hypothetical protein
MTRKPRCLDLCITLRCNAACLNCIEFCNRGDVTGLDYSDSDMTHGQILEFMAQMMRMDPSQGFKRITVAGGEPLLHPDIEGIVSNLKMLRASGYVRDIVVNSNGLIPAPASVRPYLVTYSKPEDNPRLHNVAFLHPADFSGRKQTYAGCKHYRKNTVVLNYLGWSICCAGDAYLRLFGMEDLIFDHLPDQFPFEEMDRICEHCPFGSFDLLPLERDAGCPVSDVYAREAEKNRQGSRLTKRFPSRR